MPLRFISESMGAKVDYQQTETQHLITIGKPTVVPVGGGGALRRSGETDAVILDRIHNGAKSFGNDAGKVSANWIHPDFRIMYADPFNNGANVQVPWGFTIKNAKEFAGKGKDFNVSIELIDDRYVPYEKHIEIRQPSGNWIPLEGPLSVTKNIPLENFQGNIVYGTFDFYPLSTLNNANLRTKGHSHLLAPYLGDLVRYRVTFNQGSESHTYEFDVRYGHVMTDKHLNNYVKPELRAQKKADFQAIKLYERETRLLRMWPLNWTQVN